MTSIVGEVPKAGLEEAIPVWFKLDWSPEAEQRLYKDWGYYYSRKGRENFAQYYYNKALDITNEDYKTLYNRSQSKRKRAMTESALQDSRDAAHIAKTARGGDDSIINLAICDALYELNQFEDSFAELHNNLHKFAGIRVNIFQDRVCVLHETLLDTLGVCLGPFLAKYEKMFAEVMENVRAKSLVDNRPLWKILKEQGKCDVMSIPEMEEELLSPLELARRKRAFNVFNQNYLNESWIDVVFLKNLQKNPNLLLQYCKYSKDYLNTLSTNQYEVVKKFLKMLHTRSPLYYIRCIKYKDKKMLDKLQQKYLFRIQYQTRRNMISALRSVRYLREKRNVSKLMKYVEELMGDYVMIKTNRLMPWKFEFMNDIYNTLALALVDQYNVPKRFRTHEKNALLKILRLPTDKSLEYHPFVFGDRSTHQEPDLVDPSVTKSRQMIARLERRLIFAKYSIEKCYLLHQIAYFHLVQSHFDECTFYSGKAIKESEQGPSLIWRFLSNLLIIKAAASLHKVERIKDTLEKTHQVAEQLKNPKLIKFVETCMACNEEELFIKKASIMSSVRSSYDSSHQSLHSDLSAKQKSKATFL
ncbi:uncharacterized protein LOC115624829 [Scaptodrosophila lebanonensis]|uniref:Uncharacterized protein LOC115624829 n=1 Tax=Drosophila lebanonensis TaxID=7225 RepID=A0A6J2TFM4_DROLE|nr:uncharacterized protein LOC115624829 [Scaptodrosophila lebanonensis]